MTERKRIGERNPLAMTRLQLPSAIADGGQAYFVPSAIRKKYRKRGVKRPSHV